VTWLWDEDRKVRQHLSLSPTAPAFPLARKEILSHLLAGHSNKLIARELGITEATVKVHLKSVLRKIGADNRTQAAIWALANLPEINVPRSFV
jgi:DNA-binding NarL/FixJ family response regulator